MAKQIDKPINEAADQGVGLAFVAYPAALSRLPLPWLWSVIFFLMLITLGFGSQMTIVETVVSNIIDLRPAKLQTKRPMVLGAVCFVLFLAGLPMTTGVRNTEISVPKLREITKIWPFFTRLACTFSS